MEKSYKILEFDKVLVELAEFATTNLGKQRCLDAQVYSDVKKIEKELLITREVKQIIEEEPFSFTTIFDLDSYFKQKNSIFDIEIICDFKKSLREFRLTKTFFEKFQKDTLSNLVGKIIPDKELENKIAKVINDDFQIKQDASAELKRLYQEQKETETNLRRTINSLLGNSEFQKQLQDNIWTMRDERVVFQIKAESKNKIEGIVHDVSATSQTYFVEPKPLIAINNKVKEIKLQIRAEIERLLAVLTNEIKIKKNEILTSNSVLIELDFILAKAKYAIKNEFCEPEIAADKIISLGKIKNPILMKYSENVVENDFEIGKDFISLILTGSNTGGKTVLLKTIGLCVLMMKAGMFISAKYGKLYPFTKVFSDIGDEQSIEQSLSSFSSHIKNISYILENSDENSIVLLDELCSGTDPKEGSALAQAILMKLADKNVINITTTHYSEMKNFAFSDKRFQNACVEFDLETLKPTYHLLMGVPGASNALNIAKNMNFDQEIIDNAKKFYFEQNDDSQKILQDMQEIRNKLVKAETETQTLKEEAKKAKEEYQKELDKFKVERKRQIKTFKIKYDTKIADAKAEIKQIIDEVRRTKSEKITRRAYSRIGDIEKNNRNEISAQEEILKDEYKEIDWSKVQIGDKFIIKDINQEVEIVELPNKKGDLFVQMGLIKMKTSKEKLAVVEDKYLSKQTKRPSQKISKFELGRQSLSQTLDLRGYRCEDALCELENYLDKASLYNLSPVYIIHGHGTGVLKQAVRDFANSSPYVAKYRIGEPAEGGDGVIVIDIK